MCAFAVKYNILQPNLGIGRKINKRSILIFHLGGGERIINYNIIVSKPTQMTIVWNVMENYFTLSSRSDITIIILYDE